LGKKNQTVVGWRKKKKKVLEKKRQAKAQNRTGFGSEGETADRGGKMVKEKENHRNQKQRTVNRGGGSRERLRRSRPGA